MSGADVRDVAPAQRTVPRVLDLRAQQDGDRLFVSAPGGERTFAELRDAVASRAGALLEAGLRPGDRVALMSSNRIELLETMLACAWAGFVAVPVNTALRGPGLRHVLTDSAPALLVLEAEHRRPVAAALGADDPPPQWVIGAPSFPAAGAPAPAPAADVLASDIATVMYTSGTTGPAKGVLGPHGQVVAFAAGVCELLEIREDDVLFTCLPLFHVNAWSAFFQALLAGARYVVRPRFSASRFLTEAVEHEATVTYLLGAMIPILLSRPASPLDREHRLRIVNGMGPPEPMATELRERFGLEVAECYASTETGCVLGAPLDARRPGWMGRAMPGWEVRVVDEDDLELAPGVAGELAVRATEPNAVAAGYLNRADATLGAWRNLWFHTGDRVVRDEDGWVRFLDRLTDSIRRRGENISSADVEAVLQMHPSVAAAAAFAVPSELGEDEVMAAVVPASEAVVDPLELVRSCEGRLAYFAIPRYVDVVEALPLTENGKVRKAVLRERGVTAATFDLEASGHRLERPAR